ncbi:MAG TPA: SAM-dependent methyltransferase [Azospira sp.]|nr:SAM-dependent methyltransferase [Azospira sp.]
MALPLPDSDALAHSQRLTATLAAEIDAQGGWIGFERYMELALYALGLGYYTAGARKFGAAGDFVTAPELSPLFAQALAPQAAQIMAASGPHIIEAGAGTGRLAADLLAALEALGCLPESYAILDLSPDLRQRQAETLAARVPHLADRVRWLEALPERFAGLVLGNEVLDAMPVHLAAWRENGIFERGVSLADGVFAWSERPAGGELLARATALAEECAIPPAGYISEIGLAGPAWAASWGPILETGALLLLDYGFPRREFYHPQRGGGTLMCHYRHHSHPDPFHLPGLTDITAHVDFTAVAEAAFAAGLEVLGYTAQGQFLMNAGLLQCLAGLPGGSVDYLKATAMVQKLVQPHEMGELFKVIALGKGLSEPLIGFQRGDRSHTL